ncbi:HAMP domain-containing histidine kinase [Mucilaginibacter sp. BJC16-A38]|uniref:sensor histidine kinase n=1 Tax=Mucilaginibacter phenanthrenivorans TaxID=1234842 RepID=UPI00215792DD|nr:HAMP domain-containing sensor histidine kinase [Mucilaginibacter phenanthrenivorans]MCR8560377.1 HAMP domain-containing histidine kinase [Mucilaginibacter phenanthrenivorans]
MSLFACAQQQELAKLKRDLSAAKDSLAILRLMNKVGFLIHMKSADSSFYYGVKANQLAERLHDDRGRADALSNIATGLLLKGLYSQSLNYFSEAYQVYSRVPDTIEMAQMLMNLAINYSFTSDSGRTREFAARALHMASGYRADSALSMLYANYVELAGLGPDSTAIYLGRAGLIARRFKDERATLFILQERAKLLMLQKNNAAARPLIMASILMARKHDWDYHEMEGLGLLGTYYKAVGRPDSALACFLKIYRMAGVNGYVYWKIDVLKSILQVYKQQGNLQKQAATNELLIAALDKENEAGNAFLGDYIRYKQDQEKLAKLNQLEQVNRKKQFWFIACSITGFAATIVLLLGYSRSKKYAGVLQALNERITSQNKVLKDNDEFNSRLLSMLAHDFRAPLGQIISMISLLREDELDTPARMSLYDNVEEDARNILVTFDNILHWVKKQLTGYKLVPEPLDLSEMIGQSAQLFHPAMAAKHITFNNLVDPLLVVNSDREIIQFINRNLIHNAIKYSPENGTITATMKTSAAEIVVCIRNEGRGMTEKQLNALFTFRQKESSDRGAGMALTLSKEFVALLNGNIWAESKPGEGAAFYYTLPSAT